MTIGETIRKAIKEVREGVLKLVTFKDFKLTDDVDYSMNNPKYYNKNWIKPKRARGKKGKFLADDKSTAYTNEAWVGGKAPKKKAKRKTKGKK